ncbi:MAG: CotH kinase family protein [Acholeplasmataceae bacterium]
MAKKILMILMILFNVWMLTSCDTVINNDLIEPSEPEEIGTFNRLFDGVEYRKVTITLSSDAWNELSDALIDHKETYGNLKTDTYVLADFLYEDSQGELEIENIGLRTRGNLSLDYLMDDQGNINMNSFKVNFRDDFDGTYPENDGRRGFDLKELDMKWNRNEDATYMSEQYALDMMNQFGVYAAETTHFILSFVIDGTETVMGLYTGFEPIDDEFIERRFSKDAEDGDLYKSLWQQYGPATLETITNQKAIGIRDVSKNYLPSYDLKTNKDTSDHSAFKSFITQINQLNDDDFQSYIEDNFEVEMFLRLLAVNAFIGNPDDYRAMGNNYFIYQNSKTNKWMMIPYDFDHGLGQGWWESSVYPNYSIGVDIYTWFDLNDYLGNRDYTHPLVDKILAIDSYKTMYTEIIQEILDDTYFTTNYFLTEYGALKSAFENTFNDALDHQSFGLRNVESYIDLKRDDIEQQLK